MSNDVAPAGTARIPDWARRFYLRQLAWLTLSALALLWLFHATRLDLRLEAPYYDAVNRTFPWRYAWFTKYLVHRYLKYLLILFGLGVWAAALYAHWRRVPRFMVGRQRRWWVVALAFVLVPAASAVLRYANAMHCPWDIVDFGGYAPYIDLLQAAAPGIRPGRCFPAGFVTAGAWLLAFALLWYPERRLRSGLLGLGLAIFALGLGWVQQMRGAHFLSHTLWSLWLGWLLIVTLHVACRAWRESPGR